MTKFVKPGSIKGILAAPSSKSMMQRAIAIAALADGRTTILSPSHCDDAEAAIRIAKALGAKIEESSGSVLVDGNGVPTGAPLHCGEAGLSMRMFAPICSLFPQEMTLTASGSLAGRPMTMVETALEQLGVDVRTDSGFPPLTVRGPLKPTKIRIDASMSSQLLTGLLLALPLADGDSEIEVLNLKSRPYVEMTLELINTFGVTIEHNVSLSHFQIPGRQRYRGRSYRVEGDWSGASCLLVAGAIAGQLEIRNLRRESLQADRAILDALTQAGAEVVAEEVTVHVKKAPLHGFTFDATDCPDLFPALSVLACYCAGDTTLKGVTRLRHKESDRAAALTRELTKVGAHISIEGDFMKIRGTELSGGEVNSHNDHRIAMALGVAALGSEHGIEISEPECVNKSYPLFFRDLELVRA